MKKIILSLAFLSSAFIAFETFADHSPEIMMRNMKAYSQLSETGKLGSFDVNFEKFGDIPNSVKTAIANKEYDRLLADKFNLSAIVMRDGKVIYERYDTKRGIDNNTPLQGMSMSKTAVAASVGSLLCSGQIASLNDKAGRYSKFLASTPYGSVSIKNILQMNSGVSPLGRGDEKRFNQKSRGMQKFAGNGDIREALNFYKSASRNPGSQMNYHSTDSLALSVLVEEISGQSLAKYFYTNLYKEFGEYNFMQWTSDKNGTTVSFSDLVMTARDWANFGQYLMTQKIQNSCLGNFFSEGVEGSVDTGKENLSRYGYQSWVFNVNGKPTMVLQGHGGQFIVLDEVTNTLLLTISRNEQYEVGNLFSHIHKIAERIIN